MVGMVMKRNLNHSVARSTDAASKRVFGTDARPARAISMMNGVHCQVSAMTTDHIACCLSVQTIGLSGSIRPIFPRRKLIRPKFVSIRKRQKRPTTTLESIIGRRNSVVTMPFALNSRLRRSARPKPSASWRRTLITTKAAVVVNDCQDSGRESISV